ncbi:ESPR domain-containing protein, partial [Burkholderia multivorans]|nr:ESPR domain-containing protein [Burkholderia multivorans]
MSLQKKKEGYVVNHSFRSIWSDTSGCWIAVAETTRARGKRARSGTARAARLARPAAC